MEDVSTPQLKRASAARTTSNDHHRRMSRGWTALALPALAGTVLVACGGGSSGPPAAATIPAPAAPTAPAAPASRPPTTGTGALTVSVADIEGKPMVGAQIGVFNSNQSGIVGSMRTGTNGTAAFSSVPATVLVHVGHEFGVYVRQANVVVAQQGSTLLPVVMQPDRPRPTVALLPVSIQPGSVSTDRSELTLEITLVASPRAAFPEAGYGDYSDESTPALGLALGQWANDGDRQCFVWVDRTRTTPDCGPPWSTPSPYTVSVQSFVYDAAGTVPALAARSPARSAMLMLDQGQRVLALDPQNRRSFALRRFIDRAVSASEPLTIALAGASGDGAGSLSALPSRPLWLPLGTGTPFSTDGTTLKAAVDTLEPLVGGVAPVFGAVAAALSATSAQAPPGNRVLVAMLGGGDGLILSAEARRAALSALRQQRDDAGIQALLIMGAPVTERAERLALAELAAALRAPTISLGYSDKIDRADQNKWTAGSFAALDLAADLIGGSTLPSLHAVFRVKANSASPFLAGAILYGVVYLESDHCPMGCAEFPVEFAVQIP